MSSLNGQQYTSTNGKPNLKKGLSWARHRPTWKRGITPVANGLDRWQQRVSRRSRNRTLLTVLGAIGLYAIYLFISVFS